MNKTRFDISNFNFAEAEVRVMAHLQNQGMRPWIVAVRELDTARAGSKVVKRFPTVMAATAEGALSQARDRYGHTLGRDQWLTIELPGGASR